MRFLDHAHRDIYETFRHSPMAGVREIVEGYEPTSLLCAFCAEVPCPVPVCVVPAGPVHSLKGDSVQHLQSRCADIHTKQKVPD